MRFPLLATTLCCAALLGSSSCVRLGVAATASAETMTVVASDQMSTKKFNVGYFKSLHLTGIADVVYDQKGGSCALSATGPNNVLKYFKVEVKNDQLFIGMETPEGTNLKLTGNKHVTFHISAPALTDLVSAGTGDFKSADMSLDHLNISLAGTGDVDIKRLSCRQTDISLGGTGDIEIDKIDGTSLNLALGGTGDVEIKNVTLVNTILNVGGTGDISLSNINGDMVKATVGGTGDISLKGTVRKAEYFVGGTGDISARGLKASEVNANASGSGSIECTALTSIQAACTSVASITYWGSPSQVKISENVRRGK